MSAPIDDGVLDDEIKLLRRAPEIPASVVDDDFHLGIAQRGGEARDVKLNFDLAGIDFHHRDMLHLVEVRQHLEP